LGGGASEAREKFFYESISFYRIFYFLQDGVVSPDRSDAGATYTELRLYRTVSDAGANLLHSRAKAAASSERSERENFFILSRNAATPQRLDGSPAQRNQTDKPQHLNASTVHLLNGLLFCVCLSAKQSERSERKIFFF